LDGGRNFRAKVAQQLWKPILADDWQDSAYGFLGRQGPARRPFRARRQACEVPGMSLAAAPWRPPGVQALRPRQPRARSARWPPAWHQSQIQRGRWIPISRQACRGCYSPQLWHRREASLGDLRRRKDAPRGRYGAWQGRQFFGDFFLNI